MSFTSIVKNEVSKIETNELEKIAELSAIISTGAIIENDIKITTENASVARRIFNFVKECFRFKRKNIKNNLTNYDLDKINNILNKYNHSLNNRAEDFSLEEFIDIFNNLKN